MALVNSQPAPALVHRYRPLDRAEYDQRLSINARWPNKILLSVTIELLRHSLTTNPEVSEIGEINYICTILQDQRFRPRDCTEDAVRYHFENFNFPALTHIISKLSTYETADLQEPCTYETGRPIYDAFEICVQTTMTGQLLHKDVSDQPFDMSGLTTTLRRILDYARIQNFTEVYGRNAPWDGFQEAEEFDNHVIVELYTSALNDVYDKCDAKTPEEKTYCQTIFHDVGYHGIRDIWAPAPIPWWKRQQILCWLDNLPEATDPERTEPRNIVYWSVHGLHQILEEGNRLIRLLWEA